MLRSDLLVAAVGPWFRCHSETIRRHARRAADYRAVGDAGRGVKMPGYARRLACPRLSLRRSQVGLPAFTPKSATTGTIRLRPSFIHV
jgi:hypothetical protein